MNIDDMTEEQRLEWKNKILVDKLDRRDRAIAILVKALSFYADTQHIRTPDAPYKDGDLHLEGNWLQSPDYDVYFDAEDGTCARSAIYKIRWLLD